MLEIYNKLMIKKFFLIILLIIFLSNSCLADLFGPSRVYVTNTIQGVDQWWVKNNVCMQHGICNVAQMYVEILSIQNKTITNINVTGNIDNYPYNISTNELTADQICDSNNICISQWAQINQTPTLDQIGNPVADKIFTLGGHTIDWRFTNPIGGVRYLWEGGASGHLFELMEDSSGNTLPGTHLLHVEANDIDTISGHFTHNNDAGTALMVDNGIVNFSTSDGILGSSYNGVNITNVDGVATISPSGATGDTEVSFGTNSVIAVWNETDGTSTINLNTTINGILSIRDSITSSDGTLEVYGNVNVTRNISALNYCNEAGLCKPLDDWGGDGLAKYQFTNNNFNGSGNFATTGSGRFDGGLAFGTAPSSTSVLKSTYTTSGDETFSLFETSINVAGMSSSGEVYQNVIGVTGLYGAITYGSYNYIYSGAPGNDQTLYGEYTQMDPHATGVTVYGKIVASPNYITLNNPTARQIGVMLDWSLGGTDSSMNRWALYNEGTAAGSKIFLGKDNVKTYFGTGYDTSIYYDGTKMIINPKEVGTGKVNIMGNLNATNITASDTLIGKTLYNQSDEENILYNGKFTDDLDADTYPDYWDAPTGTFFQWMSPGVMSHIGESAGSDSIQTNIDTNLVDMVEGHYYKVSFTITGASYEEGDPPSPTLSVYLGSTLLHTFEITFVDGNYSYIAQAGASANHYVSFATNVPDAGDYIDFDISNVEVVEVFPQGNFVEAHQYYLATDYAIKSDRNLKSELVVIDNSSDRKLYEYEIDGKREVGLIADELPANLTSFAGDIEVIKGYALMATNYVDIGKLKDLVSNLENENTLIKSELCKKDSSYSWCRLTEVRIE